MPAYLTKGAPLTYIIDYGDHLNRIPEAIDALRNAPPTLFHGGQDMAYIPRVGASDFRSSKGRFTKQKPSPWALPLSLEQAKARVEATRRWTKEVHDIGIEIVIPYICNQTIGGDPEARTGLWWFYDRWEEYAEDAGPKPPADPIEWMQREPDGRLHFNYPYRFVRTDPPRRFAPCPNNPYWHDWLKRVVRMLARDGFDGVFVDNNILHCHCEHCQREFRRYLTETYTPGQRRQRFGTDDVSGLRLATVGDVVLWATAQEAYRKHLKATEPGEFREKFGTEDAKKAIMSEAGNGFHWGRSYNFWKETLRGRHAPEEVERILREGDLASLGVNTPRDRCLWADTQKFWAWSIGRRNAELRDAAEDIRPGFIIVPNWGDMSGFRHTVGRMHEAKNVRLWGPGADVMFFEEEYFPGTLAPGYTFDLMIPYKYSAACGSRSCALPYRGSDHRALCELATAEAATWGGDGMFVQPNYAFPEVRKQYRAFYESHADWYTGHTSYANVGLVLSFDDAHMENTHHLREAYSLARYLADHHILFDFLCEGQITARELSRFQVVVVPHVQFLPLGARRALIRYLDAGGGLFITGNTGAFDEHARPARKRDLLADVREMIWRGKKEAKLEYHGNGSLIWINDVFSWLPKRSWQIHDLADVGVEELTKAILPALAEAAKNEPADDPRLLEMLDRLVRRPLPVLSSKTPHTLRVSAWRKTRGNPSLLVQLLNYDVPGPGLPVEGEAMPVENVEVRLLLPNAMRVNIVLSANPWEPQERDLSFHQRGDEVRFTVPRVNIYQAIRLR